jgi:predicted dinucleotide-binding enzyme
VRIAFLGHGNVGAPLADRLQRLGHAVALAAKVLVDCTNPVGPGLRHGLASVQSGSEAVQKLVPEARVAKAFSIYGFENFEDSRFPAYDVQPAMPFCGNDARAKATVGTLIAQLGFEPLDVGGLEQALHLEHMTLLWVRMVLYGRRLAAPGLGGAAALRGRTRQQRKGPTREAA